MNIFPVIMAGGIGTRFWPLSQKNKPKQFLPITSEKTMIEETVSRLLPKVPASHIFTIANFEQTQTLKKLLPSLSEKNFLVEPQGKNTAPSLLLATAIIFRQNPQAIIAALPADHLIKNPSLFLKKLEAGALAAEKKDCLITFGIPPAFPSTGFGYIQFTHDDSIHISNETFYLVQQFKEKPDLHQAKVFLKKGNYFWNSGMFLWKAEAFVKKVQKYSPSLFSYWKQILKSLENNDKHQIRSIFEEIPSISIDYALMEKAEGVLMCKGDFEWSDVGTWSSLVEIWPRDQKGIASRGNNIVIDSKNCLVYNPEKLTALVGVKDIIVVDTPDALLICHKKQDQKVKDIVEILKKKRGG